MRFSLCSYFKGGRVPGIVVLLTALLGSLQSSAQWISTPPYQDGTINTGEYGSNNSDIQGHTKYYMTWDNNNLYIGIEDSDNKLNYEAALCYLDFDNDLPVNTSDTSKGSTQGYYTYDHNHLYLPFASNAVIFASTDSFEVRLHANGYWKSIRALHSYPTSLNSGTVEISIPWNILTGSTRPTSFNFFFTRLYYNASYNNGIYYPSPAQSPNSYYDSNGNRKSFFTEYHTVTSTADGSSTPPFSLTSYTFYNNYGNNAPGYDALNNESFYDVTVNDTLSSASSGISTSSQLQLYGNGTLTINHNLYISPHSALIPQYNSVDNLVFDGTANNLYNYGWIDCNDVTDVPSDPYSTRINTTVSGNLTINPNGSIGGTHTRFSDITITSTGTIQPQSAGGPVYIELQYGTLTNNGVFNGGDGTGGTLDYTIRGDVSQNYYIIAPKTSSTQFHNLIIGALGTLLPYNNSGYSFISLSGDFENYGNLQATNGSGILDVTMNGLSGQTLKGQIGQTNANTTPFHSLEIANSGTGVSFYTVGGSPSNNIIYTISDTLKLTNGKLITFDGTNRNVVKLSSGAKLLDASASASTFVSGPLTWTVVPGTDSLNFPIGKDTTFRAMDVKTTVTGANPVDITGEFFNFSPSGFGYSLPTSPDSIFNVSDINFWNVKVSDNTALSNFQVTLNYGSSALSDGVTDPSGLRVMRQMQSAPSSSTWINSGPITGGSGIPGSITTTPFTPFSTGTDLTLGNTVHGANPLPVTWLYFRGQADQSTSLLKWATATEQNAAYFDVQRSSDGQHFYSIGSVAASGYSAQNNYYNFTDQAPLVGKINYYRLHQIDYNGDGKYSSVEAVNFSGSHSILLYPNPATNEIHYFSSSPAGENGQFIIKNALGKEIKKVSLANGSTVEIADLPDGVYWLCPLDGNAKPVKFVKIR